MTTSAKRRTIAKSTFSMLNNESAAGFNLEIFRYKTPVLLFPN